MRIAIDAMGGDHAPEVVVNAALQTAEAHPDWQLLLVGTEEVLGAHTWPENIRPVPCSSVMGMDESVENLIRKKDSSIWVATELVKKQEADAVVSAGSTAAQMASATLLLGRIKGVSRPALGTVIPTANGGKLLLDIGANPDCTPEMLLQFAQMGTAYATQLLEIEHPAVALLSNGTEAHKGNKVTLAAYDLLEQSGLRFIGNKEGRDVLVGDYDVLVADGMCGNITIKSIEGAVSTLMGLMKAELTATFTRKIGAALVKGGMRNVKRHLDYQEYGGAPLLGVKGVSIVCHGSSKEKALIKAVEVAVQCVEQTLVEKIAQALQQEAPV